MSRVFIDRFADPHHQWGCLGDEMRVTLHPRFDESIIAINKILEPKFCIFDGTYFLDHTGPITGKPVPMNLVIAGDDLGAASLACCEIMQIDPFRIAHHRVAEREGLFPPDLSAVTLNQSPTPFAQHRFQLRRAPLNYIHLAAFHNGLLNRLFYNSTFADGLHEMLWFLRRNPLIRRTLYGKYGPGAANRGGRAA